MKQKEREIEARKRREIMHRLREMDFTNADIARLYDISPGRVGQIFRRMKEDEKNALGISKRAYKVLQGALKMESPTLIDLSMFILRSPFWRNELHKVRMCGAKTLREIESFAEASGVKTGAERKLQGLGERAYNVLKRVLHTDSPDLSDLRRFMKDDWRDKLARVPGCGPKTIEELEEFGVKKGLSRKS